MRPILSLHADYGISGVSAWGARIAAHPTAHPWHLALVGASPERARAWAERHGAPPERVHACGRAQINDLLGRLGAAALVPNDVDPGEGFVPATPMIALAHGGDLGWRERIERLAPASAALVAVGPHVLDTMDDALPAGVARLVQPCGIDIPERWSPAPRGPRLRLAYLGRFDRVEKRTQDLARLAERLARRGVGAIIHAVGDGPDRDTLEQVARAHPEHLTLGPPCPPACAHRLIESCDALVLTSATEGWPTAAMEALARGRPVLATTGSGGVVPAIERFGCGRVVPTGDVEALADAVSAWADDPRAPAALASAARSAAEALVDGRAAAGAWDALVDRLGASPPAGAVRTPERTALERLVSGVLDAAGAQRAALYGMGAHTRRLERLIAREGRFACIVDDRAGAPGCPASFAGVGVCAPEQAAGFDAVLCSSDAWEDDLAQRAARWAGGVPVLRLYDRGSAWGVLRARAATRPRTVDAP